MGISGGRKLFSRKRVRIFKKAERGKSASNEAHGVATCRCGWRASSITLKNDIQKSCNHVISCANEELMGKLPERG